MSNKHFVAIIAGVSVVIEAEEEGVARFMVRVQLPGHGKVRAGYLTGTGTRWVMEFYHGPVKTSPFNSAEEACQACAEAAVNAGVTGIKP